MSRNPFANNPFLLGFEDVERLVERAMVIRRIILSNTVTAPIGLRSRLRGLSILISP